MSTATDDREFAPVYNRYSTQAGGLPRLPAYLRETWRRRAFAAEYSRANIRSANSNTVFGQLWLVLNPVLLAGVYFLLVNILTGRGKDNPEYFTHLTGSLFIFTMVTTAMTSGASSVTTAGKLLLNTAFPRILIPLSVVRTAVFRFLPTVPVILIFQLFTGNPWSPLMLLSLVFAAFMVLFGAGLACFFAALQVYFRDTQSFLPYINRLWLYLSPVLWTGADLSRLGEVAQLAILNPMYAMLTGYTQLLQHATMPAWHLWAISAAWSIGMALLGGLFFITRERDFAVRIY
ncbi:ABC transporter permease [Parenemella sanctibonifatiensis]|uniref:ABC transporter permease n=1 Tax=Parenemella sanctibonifatiensis TaxID=2016505 RepID=A0A255EFJ7_9ACTN|nr:ABC transporter permease [Parenemella sanctibonifatiensis]OYN90308.1 ABC transporter permease [Parenemella sanctibonifatiensis]